MIVSLVLKDMQSVDVGERGIFELKNTVKVGQSDTEVKTEKQNIKDVPFVRYRFKSYGENEIAYIKKLQGVFKYSAHLAEITLGEDFNATIQTVKELTEKVDRLCRFVYVPVDDVLLNYVNENKALPEELEDALYDIADIEVDQICIKDITSAASIIKMNNVRKSIADVVIGSARKYESIGICGSPLTFVADESACLTAAKAREMMAIYCRDDLPQPTPSANHQCMNCCGCIQYVIVDEPIKPYTKSQTKKVSSSKSKKSTSNENSPKSDSKKVKSAKSNKTESIMNTFF